MILRSSLIISLRRRRGRSWDGQSDTWDRRKSNLAKCIIRDFRAAYDFRWQAVITEQWFRWLLLLSYIHARLYVNQGYPPQRMPCARGFGVAARPQSQARVFSP